MGVATILNSSSLGGARGYPGVHGEEALPLTFSFRPVRGFLNGHSASSQGHLGPS